MIGAGASYGEHLVKVREEAPGQNANPPLVNGFFDSELWNRVEYLTAEQDFREAFQWINTTHLRGAEVPIGQGRWRELNLEEIFTWLELRREFESPESTDGAKLRIIRNQLVGYICRIISLCTQNANGEHSRYLASILDQDDSIITFNWDLLLDDPLLVDHHQYENFLDTLRDGGDEFVFHVTSGMYLKLHGSLNWFRCTNSRCRSAAEISFHRATQECLDRAIGIHRQDESCTRCGSAMLPLLIPPLLRKPITEDSIIRSIWGLARQKLQTAVNVVVIGFSAAPTDFYAAWLLRSTLDREDVRVIVVNPTNEEGTAGHDEFVSRMQKIFPRGYNDQFHRFEEIPAIRDVMRRAVIAGQADAQVRP